MFVQWHDQWSFGEYKIAIFIFDKPTATALTHLTVVTCLKTIRPLYNNNNQPKQQQVCNLPTTSVHFGGTDGQMLMAPTNRMIGMAWRIGSAKFYNAIVWFWGTIIL
jgi:hypothetical protein